MVSSHAIGSLLAWALVVAAGVPRAPGELPSDLIPTPGAGTDAATGLPLEVQTRATGHILRLVPPGGFTMGSEDGDVDEKPVHAVEKSAFYLGKFPVTNLQYEKFDPGHQRGKYSPGDDHPVTYVAWKDAAAYVLWVGRQEGKPDLYALPSEGAWEKAARGGLEGARYPWGNTMSPEGRNLYSSASAAPVDSGQPNGLGFYHMTGNVFCWCWDWYDRDYYKGSPGQDPFGPATGTFRSMRGGTWYVYDKSLRCADRWCSPPDTVSDYVGIRIARRVTGLSLRALLPAWQKNALSRA